MKEPSTSRDKDEKPVVEGEMEEDTHSAVDLFSKSYQKSRDDVRR